MSAIAIVDGAISALEHANVSVCNRAFLYGEGAFETLRTYGRRPFALLEHLTRLRASAHAIGMPVVTNELLRNDVARAIDACPSGEVAVRIIAFQTAAAPGLDCPAQPSRVVLAETLRSDPSLYENGVSAITLARPSAAGFPHSAKLTSYLANVLARTEAKRQGAAEAVWISPDGAVVDGSTCAVLMLHGNRLMGLPEDPSRLCSITQRHALQVAERLGTTATARPFTVDDLRGAEEAFVCASLREIVPLVRLDDQPIGSGRPGPYAERLRQAYRTYAAASAAQP